MFGSRHDLETLLRLRDETLAEMETADREFSALRMQVERAESDLRIGRPEAANYQQLKGRELPQAEARVLEAYRNLLKLEDRILAEQARG